MEDGGRGMMGGRRKEVAKEGRKEGEERRDDKGKKYTGHVTCTLCRI